jgi:hypothetical protein
MAGFCEHCNEPPGGINAGKFLGCLCHYKLLVDSVPWKGFRKLSARVTHHLARF